MKLLSLHNLIYLTVLHEISFNDLIRLPREGVPRMKRDQDRNVESHSYGLGAVY